MIIQVKNIRLTVEKKLSQEISMIWIKEMMGLRENWELIYDFELVDFLSFQKSSI